jgi:squalene synthase HpnC/squalene synthase HpnD
MLSPAELEISRALPPAGCSVDQAQRYTRWLAAHHYENFHVATWLLPRRLRQHFCNVYAYCRWADDLGDEIADPLRALELLDAWEQELDRCYAGRPSHAVLVALAPTITTFDIPAEPFRDLLTAFRQDQGVHQYESWSDLLGYCRYSANPVGRLVLYVCGYRDAARQQLSDATCTALQLANFWQDVSRDLEKGRLYIPLEALRRHGLSAADIEARRFDARYAALMKDLIARTRTLFAEGAPLQATVDARLRVDLDLFGRGGLAVLEAIEQQGYNTLERRPAIGATQRLSLLARAATATAVAMIAPNAQPEAEAEASGAAGRVPAGSGVPQGVTAVEVSYAECRRVARSAASNFYYAFYMLPRAKRDALCALYAFMRLVDDVSDANGPGAGTPENLAARRAALAGWRNLLDQAVAGDTAQHPILPAFADTIGRYQIAPRYFHDLISGAEMDLTETRYATFERLQEYCYRVAGTVGLTCLGVFGSDHPHAPELAERLGIAFQLTNILRDVQGDLEMGRVYLPTEDLERVGCSMDQLARGVVTGPVREVLRLQAERAWRFYAEGAPLLGRIHPDSRAALWALIRIYSSLLARIEERDFDVFSTRVRLTMAEKTGILLRARLGFWSETDVLEERNRDRRRAGGALFRRRAG